jgi:hypothetical protein
MVDEKQVVCLDQSEVNAKGVHPEAVRLNGVPYSNMASDTFVVSEEALTRK